MRTAVRPVSPEPHLLPRLNFRERFNFPRTLDIIKHHSLTLALPRPIVSITAEIRCFFRVEFLRVYRDAFECPVGTVRSRRQDPTMHPSGFQVLDEKASHAWLKRLRVFFLHWNSIIESVWARGVELIGEAAKSSRKCLLQWHDHLLGFWAFRRLVSFLGNHC